MERSMYSLILMDDVVKAIDQLAYRQGTSRSNLINRILAEYVSMPTPETGIRQIYQALSHMAGNSRTIQVQAEPTGSVLHLKSFLNFKYNPTIRYSVEIAAGGRGGGWLRLQSRSQSAGLLACLESFFQLWIGLEQELLAERSGPEIRYETSTGRFSRSLAQGPGGFDGLGQAIGSYISLLDKALNRYAEAYVQQDPRIYGILAGLYGDYLRTCERII